MIFSFDLGFIKFLEPYYMLLITKRRKIGTICGHTVYAITKSEMIPIPHPTVRSKMAYSKDENRSLVHSTCKCNMSVVHLETSERTIPCPLYLDENIVIYYGYLIEFILILSDHIPFVLLKKILLECHILLVSEILHYRAFLCSIYVDISLQCIYTKWASSGQPRHVSVVLSTCIF